MPRYESPALDERSTPASAGRGARLEGRTALSQRPESRRGPGGRHFFRLFVAGTAQNSARAVLNLNALCERYVQGRYTIEVVDALLEPRRAFADGIVVTPTLLRVSPEPRRVIIGDLSDEAVVVAALGLASDDS